MQTHQVNVQRCSIISRKPFDAVLAAVEEAIGRPNMLEFTAKIAAAHQMIIGQARKLARRAGELEDDGTNDLVVSEVLRRNELQAWFLSEHLVDAPLVHATPVHAK